MTARLLVYAIGLLVTSLLAGRLKAGPRRALLLVVSLAFYASWGPWFLAVLLGSAAVNFALGKALRRRPSSGRLWLGIAFNVALLGVFKYLPAIAQQVSAQSALGRIVLPVGLSFWTFQALSYLFDLYREEELDPTFPEFLLYMSFAPIVLSGPICRLPEILPQLRERAGLSRGDVRAAVQRIWLGALMMALAQLLGSGLTPDHGINAGFEAGVPLTAPDVWLLAFGYGFQLFFDFAGYSHIAIGAARLLGVRVPENFDRPYLSTSPSVFWTRWHMSLSFWIRDYLFLPVAAMRRETWWRNGALLFSMIVFGIWHKGAVLFVIWGAYHGVLLVLHRQWQQIQRRAGFEWSGALPDAVSWVVTFSVMCLGWIWFRAASVSQALGMFAALIHPAQYRAPALPLELYALTAVLGLGYFVGVALASRRREDEALLAWLPLEVRYACYAVALYLVVFRAAQPQAFIYSQF